MNNGLRFQFTGALSIRVVEEGKSLFSLRDGLFVKLTCNKHGPISKI